MDGLAIDRQRQDCEALAEQRGWDVVHTYVDQSNTRRHLGSGLYVCDECGVQSINTRGGQKSIAELWATNLPGTKDSYYYYNFC